MEIPKLGNLDTSSRRNNYAVINGADKSIIPVAEELVQQGFNILMIGNDSNILDQVKEELVDAAKDAEMNLSINYLKVDQNDWTKKDTITSIETQINDLDFPCLLINNYRFYAKQVTSMPAVPLTMSGIGSPSFMLYQAMMKTYPCTLITEIVAKSFYSMQKARGLDFHDKEDASTYQALDSLVFKRTNSGKKKAMKKMALFNIKESIDLNSKMQEKSQSEKR